MYFPPILIPDPYDKY